MTYFNKLCKRSPVRKTGLKLMVAYLLITGAALGTGATSNDKGHGNTITNLPVEYFFSNRFYNTSKLMAGNMG